jgi:hypothetical protein
MARYLALKSFFPCSWLVAGAMGTMVCLTPSLRAADAPKTNAPVAKSPAAPTNAAPVLPPPDTLGRYGNILAPGDQAAYPLKLKMPFPGVGELKIPSQGELVMRQKLEELALLSDDELRKQLAMWPAFSRMNLRDEGTMLQRIQDFRDYRSKTAMQKAHDMGLLTLTDAQKAQFEKEYWSKRLAMESALSKQIGATVAASEQKFKDDLFREFSSVSPGPIAQAPSKPAAPAPGKTAPVPPAKTPAPVVGAAPSTNVVPPVQPMAQAPR